MVWWALDAPSHNQRRENHNSQRAEPQSLSPQHPFSHRRFYWNRFIRIMPTYYLCTLLAVPLCLAGFSGTPTPDLWKALVVSIIPVSTLFNTSFGLPLDGPGW